MTGKPLQNMVDQAIRNGQDDASTSDPALDRNQLFLGDDPLPSHNARSDSAQREQVRTQPVHISDVAVELVRIIANSREPLSTPEVEALADLLRSHPNA